MNKSRGYSQESFRRDLIKRDQLCILSGVSHEVCEAAHIMNKEWLDKDNKELMFTKSNGILLNSSLHKEFDKYYWTVDINEEEYKQQLLEDKYKLEIEYKIKLYPPAEKKKKHNLAKFTIFDYDTITIPMECVPFFIERNEYVKHRIYNPNMYTQEDIQLYIKDDFNIYTTPQPSTHKPLCEKNISKKRSKPKSIKKKRSRYTKKEISFIHEWISKYKGLPAKPTIDERKRFSESIGIDSKVFETRFIKYWNNTK